MNRKIGCMLIVSMLGGTVAAARAAAPAGMAVHAADIVVTPAADVKYRPLDPNDKDGRGPQIAMMFGDFATKAPTGFLFKVPPGFRPGPHTHTEDYYSVVIQGTVHDFAPGTDEGKGMVPGGHWFQAGKVQHDNHCASTIPCVIFIYSPAGYDYVPVKKVAPVASARR